MRIYHGNILSCDDKNHVYQYLVEDRGIIRFVGDRLPEEFAAEAVTELGMKALLPSFVDSHLHFASMALFQSGVNVMSAENNKEIQARLKSFLPKTKAKVVIAFGASPHSVEEKRLLSREELDAVSSDRPIMVVKYDGHACIVNSALIRILPENNKSLRGYDSISGEMSQEAFFATTDYVSSTVSIRMLVRSMQKSVDFMAARGIGMMHSVSGVGFPKDIDVDLERYIGRGAEGGFQTRLFFQTMDIDKVTKRKLPRIGGCFATALDGCFGSTDAALNAPYEGTKNQGILYYSDEKVTEFCKKANRLGLQIEMHAIGDAAFDQATRALKAALNDFPRENHRHGIIHACLPTKEGIEICRKYKIHIPVQTSFIVWSQEPDWYLRNILGERATELNPLRSFVDNGVVISAGSDSPCTDPDPMLWIHNACNHPVTGQALSVEQALRMATYWGYWTTFDEDKRGSLETGKIADMVILGRNPLTEPKETLKTIPVESLILAGKPYSGQKSSWITLVMRGLFSRNKV